MAVSTRPEPSKTFFFSRAFGGDGATMDAESWPASPIVLRALQVSALATALPAMDIGAHGYTDARDGQPLLTAVRRRCRGVPSPGPRLTQGGVVCRPPTG